MRKFIFISSFIHDRLSSSQQLLTVCLPPSPSPSPLPPPLNDVGSGLQGKICGVDDAVANKENAYYLKSGEVVCVKECPSQTILDLTPGSLICAYDVQDDLDLLCSKRTTTATPAAP